jgi:glycosyltransferase involved in cell wall biosynthesis
VPVLTIVNNIPTAYRRELFESIESELPGGWTLEIVYLARSEGVRVNLPPADRPNERVLPVLLQWRNRATTTSDHIVNLGCIAEARKADAMLFFGYSYPSYLLMAAAAKLRRIPTAVFVESVARSAPRKGLRSAAKRGLLQGLFDIFIVPGPAHREFVTGHIGVPGTRVTEAVNGLRPLSYPPKPSAATGRLLFVGRIAPEKNLKLLLEAIRDLPVTLTVAGTGDAAYVAECQALAPAKVSWVGHVTGEQLDALYQSHDVLVLPSSDEPWGFIVNEAMRFGMTIVLSNAVGSAAVLIDGNGASFDPDSADDLRKALLQVLGDKPRMSAKSLELAAKYTSERQARDIVSALRLTAERSETLPNATESVA